MQIGWAIFLEKNPGTQKGGAKFLEKNGGPQIGGAIFLDKNWGAQVGWPIFLEKNQGRRGQHGPTQAENISFLDKNARACRPAWANLGGVPSTGPKATARTPTAKAVWGNIQQ